VEPFVDAEQPASAAQAAVNNASAALVVDLAAIYSSPWIYRSP